MNGLILIPTELELEILQPQIQSAVSEHGWSIELCGFGPIVSASRSASLIEQKNPDRVLLLGIAGAFDDAAPVGDATTFDRVCCFGVGVGCGDHYQSAAAVGFPQFSHDGVSIDDSLDLKTTSANTNQHRVLLTSPAASANASEAARKLKAAPDAIAEDMEGFSVAVSCRLADVPLTVIRGISNAAGDRDLRQWRIVEALSAAAKLAIEDVIRSPLS